MAGRSREGLRGSGTGARAVRLGILPLGLSPFPLVLASEEAQAYRAGQAARGSVRVSNELHAPNRPEEQLFTLVMTSTGPRPRAVAQVLRRELPEEEVDRILVGVPTVVLR